MYEFRGMDILIQQRMDDESIMRALSTLLNVPASRVAVIEDITQYPPREQADVVCVAYPAEGSFMGHLSIDGGRARFETDMAFMQAMGDAFGQRCLAPDDTLNPWGYWLLEPGRAPKHVFLDVDALEQEPWARGETP